MRSRRNGALWTPSADGVTACGCLHCWHGTRPRRINAPNDRLWSAKTKTVVDSLNHFSYIDLALASRRLCSMHRSSDTSAPGGSPAGPSLPSSRHAAGRAVRSGWVKTAGGNAEIQKGRRFNGFAGVCGSAEIRRNSRRPAVEPGNAKCRFCRVSGDSAGPPPGPEEATDRWLLEISDRAARTRSRLPFSPSKPLCRATSHIRPAVRV